MNVDRRVKYSSLREGMLLRFDDAFCCGIANTEQVVKKDGVGAYYVPCEAGHHFLDGQMDDDGFLVGITLVDDTTCNT